MINLFQIAPTDQSVYYLGRIFGYVGTLLPTQNPNLLVGILFKTLNTTALTIGALMVVYVTVVGLLKTAQEGEFLGRQWNSLWVPIRTVLGIAALFPTATGYSAIQVIIMWIILQGVGAADTLWGKTLEYLSVAGSPYASFNSSNVPAIDIEMKMKNLFSSLVCQASAKATYSDLAVGTNSLNTDDAGRTFKYYCASNPDTLFCRQSDSQMLNPIDLNNANPAQVVHGADGISTYSMGPEGACGTLSYCDIDAACKTTSSPTAAGAAANNTAPEENSKATSNITCLACKAQQSALKSIVPTLGAIAAKIVTIDNQYLQFKNTPVSDSTAIPTWVQDFCTANNIPTEQCCGVPPPQAGGLSPFGMSMAMVINDCSKFLPKTSNSVTGASSPGPDQQPPIRASNSAVEFYLKYPLASYLDGVDFINAAVGEYMAALVGAVSSDIQQQMEKTTLTGWQKSANDTGWILAGGFFYTIARMNSANQQSTKPPFKVDPLSKMDTTDSTNLLYVGGYRNNYTAVGSMLNLMTAANQSSTMGFANSPGVPSDVSSALNGTKDALLDMWRQFLGGDSDTVGTALPMNPLVAIASFGSSLMMWSQILFAVVVAGLFLFALFSDINVMVLGTGLTSSPIGEAIKALLGFVGPFFVILVISLFSLGAMLGIYVPLIPYMIFTMGAIGWMIATIEAMVAGPIIALGILSPGGQHDILGRAEPALMQLFNLFLRPSLMVLGLMISMLLSIAVVKLVNAGFFAVSSEILGSMPGLLEQIVLIAAYTSFIITALNKAFSLIYVIPERVLTWIGGPASQYGEQEALHPTKQAMEGAASGSAGAGKEAGASVQGGTTATRQANLEQEASNKSGQGGALLKRKQEAANPAPKGKGE